MAFQIILGVLLVLASAILIGEIFEQFKLPSVAGALLSGMILGPSVLGIVGPNTELQGLASVSLFFIIFAIGFEMNTMTLGKNLSRGTLLSLTSFVYPLLVAFGFGILAFPFGPVQIFIVALAVSVPSISIISVLVMQMDMLQEKSGPLILASVTLTDTAAFVILEAATGTVSATVAVVAELAVFVAAFVFFDWILNSRPALTRRMIGRAGQLAKSESISFGALILVGLTIAAIFQSIGLSYIVGAFFAGLIVHDGLIGRKPFAEVSKTFAKINGAFFIPFFFGFAGVEADLTSSGLLLVPALVLVLAASLFVGIWITFRMTRRVLKDDGDETARKVALTLGGRGAVGIAIATVSLTAGVIDTTVYSLIILSTIIASITISVLLSRNG